MAEQNYRQQISHIVIAGAGTMGSSLAQIFAQYHYRVSLFGKSERHLAGSRELIAINQATSVREGAISAEKSRELTDRIAFTLDKDCFCTADFLIETISENMDAKHAFWREASALVPGGIVLSSNTSGLSLTEIARAVENPARFCGMHWVNPPHLVPLVEVICGEKTAQEAAQIVRSLALAVKRRPVMVKKDAPGFILNRLQFTVLREAMHIVESGVANMADVDNVLKYGLGMRYACIGPFETADLGGLDVFYSIAKYLYPELCRDTEVQDLLAVRVENNRLGVKSGSGFYEYPGGRAAEAIAKRDAAFLKLAKCLFEEDPT
jgi:3-hydroxybutyryl-CoA dehydrogenase